MSEITPYCDRADIEEIYGAVNVRKWADLDNDNNTVKIAARIDRAIDNASAQLDARFRKSIYVIPFELIDTLSPGTVPLMIVNLAAQLAGVWLYENRGVTDTDQNGNATHALRWNRRAVDQTITDILMGRLTLDAVLKDELTPFAAPEVVDTLDDDELAI